MKFKPLAIALPLLTGKSFKASQFTSFNQNVGKTSVSSKICHKSR